MADFYIKNGKLYKNGLGSVGTATASDYAKYGSSSSSNTVPSSVTSKPAVQTSSTNKTSGNWSSLLAGSSTPATSNSNVSSALSKTNNSIKTNGLYNTMVDAYKTATSKTGTSNKKYTDLITSTSNVSDAGTPYNTTQGYSAPSVKGNDLGEKIDAQDKILSQAQTIDDFLTGQNIVLPEDIYEDKESLADIYKQEQEYIKEQQRIANESAVKSGVERLQNQLKTTNTGFDDAGRQAYIRATQSEYALPNQLAAMGYTGGLSETEAARGRANYQNTMADIEQQRTNAANEIYAAINELKNTADQRTAEENIALAKEYADKLLELQINSEKYNQDQKEKEFEKWKSTATGYYTDYTAQIQQLQADNANGKNDDKIAYLMALRQQQIKEEDKLKKESDQQEWENNYNTQKLGLETSQQEWNREYQKAKLMADTGDFSGLKALGYDTTMLEKQWNADLAKTNASTNSSNTQKKSNYTNVYNSVFKMMNEQEDLPFGMEGTRNKYGEDDIISYILGQGLSEEEERKMINNLGLSKYM